MHGCPRKTIKPKLPSGQQDIVRKEASAFYSSGKCLMTYLRSSGRPGAFLPEEGGVPPGFFEEPKASAWRGTSADSRDGTASHAFPAGEMEPCSPRDGARGYACRDGARAQACAPRDAGPEARDALHAARARDDSPRRPWNRAAAECIRPEEKDNPWRQAELS